MAYAVLGSNCGFLLLLYLILPLLYVHIYILRICTLHIMALRCSIMYFEGGVWSTCIPAEYILIEYTYSILLPYPRELRYTEKVLHSIRGW